MKINHFLKRNKLKLAIQGTIIDNETLKLKSTIKLEKLIY